MADEGLITDVRTGLVGALAVNTLLQPPLKTIGIVGTGTQAREQLLALQEITPCREVLIWGRNRERVEELFQDPQLASFTLQRAERLEEMGQAQLVITTTSTTTPLLFPHHLEGDTLVVAVGSDEVGKGELALTLLEQASLRVADSLTQCRAFGELARVPDLPAVELGTFINHPPLFRNRYCRFDRSCCCRYCSS